MARPKGKLVPVSVRVYMPPTLVAEVDARAQQEGLSRSSWIRAVVVKALRSAGNPRAPRE